MKALARGFLAGFGFALGASVAGTLIGYTIGRIGEASVKRLLSPERTSSPAPSSSPASSEPPDTDDELPVYMCREHRMVMPHFGCDETAAEIRRLQDLDDIDQAEHKSPLQCRDCDFATMNQSLMLSHVAGTSHRGDEPRSEHKSHYGVPVCYCDGAGRHVHGSNCPPLAVSEDEAQRSEVPVPHNADYVLEPIGERCGARNGDLVCILSKGHTKPVDHWNGTFGFDAAPFHTCEIGVPDADHPLRTDSAHCGGCAPQCDLFPGQTCTAVPQKCRTFCERR